MVKEEEQKWRAGLACEQALHGEGEGRREGKDIHCKPSILWSFSLDIFLLGN